MSGPHLELAAGEAPGVAGPGAWLGATAASASELLVYTRRSGGVSGMRPAAAATEYARSDALVGLSGLPLPARGLLGSTPLRAASRCARLSSDMGATGASNAAAHAEHKKPQYAIPRTIQGLLECTWRCQAQKGVCWSANSTLSTKARRLQGGEERAHGA
jgi:hypothetical protein